MGARLVDQMAAMSHKGWLSRSLFIKTWSLIKKTALTYNNFLYPNEPHRCAGVASLKSIGLMNVVKEGNSSILTVNRCMLCCCTS
ncbi:hypothetical protein FHU10_1210 [Serratia fonticola]|uniref:Uncharacterized protein n=1 Tax=Serratia fonticola TaxID=47917 RepID=A0A542D816_SERFO|nr:hypothetical protein FHU09_1241 [Serratia fonticola]TQI99229.1 hypothetical protein FHU11_4811 [Serratia fonticola]TVZ68754.1 hypothetical protein FHU10_1210 [Serratia fonticola]